ncbi:DNA-directed RNA polymerase II subunit RPB2 [Lates japonicus]|uniref:DNA-directed RNA polymerase II subunit RPB2 n=1 Tax=Lates japonicus TaxID=270547 RepID=A0AAD3RHU3_LATJO|nr:DNA-directed RNA polymerase II subunit RPB2 [Lates japonicus]
MPTRPHWSAHESRPVDQRGWGMTKHFPTVEFPPYFDEKGLVRQQLDLLDEFIQMSVQRIVETPTIDLQVEAQHTLREEEPVERSATLFWDGSGI